MPLLVDALDRGADLRGVPGLDLGSPHGYLVDALAIVGVFLRGAEASEDKWVLKNLGQFEDRLLGVRDVTDVRTRHRWLVGQLSARLGDFRGAADRLESVRVELLKRGPLRHAVAVTLDLSMVYCRTRFKPNLRRVRTIVEVCLKRLSRRGEEGKLRQGLHMVLWAVNRDPGRWTHWSECGGRSSSRCRGSSGSV